jgi:hypothetical protein
MAYEQLWDRLAEEAPEQVCHRTGARYDESCGRFELPVLKGTLLIDPGARCFAWREREAEEVTGPAEQAVEVAAAAYLVGMDEPPRTEEWVSPSDLPSGTFFFRGQHAAPTAPLEAAFGARLDAFRAAAEALGGTPLPFADAAYRLVVFPYLHIAVLLWRGDDEFPARARFLLNRAAAERFLLDALLAVMETVVDRLIRLGEEAG